jgi:hypothetical protein
MVRPTATTPREGGPAARPSSLSATDVDTTDWPAQAADTIERVVQGVRDKTTGPAITAARWVVAGLFLLVAGTAALILLTVMLVRLLDAYLPDSVFGEDHVWAAHTILGVVVTAFGLALLRKRNRPSSDAS